MTSSELGPTLRAAYVRLVEQRFGLRLASTTVGQLDGIVPHLVATSPYSTPTQLFDAFAAGLLPRLLEVLCTRLTSGEPSFFRLAPQIEAMRKLVLPDLLARHATDRRLRVWSAGCSTGEEAYTLAMLIREQLPTPRDWDVRVVASDIDRAAIELARAGVYGEWSLPGSPGDLGTRYLAGDDTRWQVADPLRRMVHFAHVNLAADPPALPHEVQSVDLIVCCGVTVSFHELATRRLYQRFARTLTPSGWLMLGPSDPPATPGLGFEEVVAEGTSLWRRRPDAAQLVPRAAYRSGAGAALPIPVRRTPPRQTRVKRPPRP
jgi:chemotaxis protein methyltransferase CheR